jgi:O-acetylserine/cysteine efflux transporter
MPKTMPPRPAQSGLGPTDLMVALAINLLWGFNTVALKISVDAVEPFSVALLRQMILLAVCLPYLRIIPGKMLLLIGNGLLTGGLFMALTNLAFSLTPNVSALAIAGQLGVPFALILAIIFHGERIAWPRITGILLSFVGVVLLVFQPAAPGDVMAIGVSAAASLLWAWSSLIQRKMAGIDLMTSYAWVAAIGTLFLAPLAWAIEPEQIRTLGAIRLDTLGWIAYSAIGSTLLGYGGLTWLLRRHPVTLITPLLLLSPVLGVLASVIFLDAMLTPLMIIGGMITMIGVAIISLRSARKAIQL